MKKLEIKSTVNVNRQIDPDILGQYSAIALLFSCMSVDEEIYGENVKKFDEWLAEQPVGKKFKITIEEVD